MGKLRPKKDEGVGALCSTPYEAMRPLRVLRAKEQAIQHENQPPFPNRIVTVLCLSPPAARKLRPAYA